MTIPKQLQPRRPLAERLTFDVPEQGWDGPIDVPATMPELFRGAMDLTPTFEGKLRLAAQYVEQGLVSESDVRELLAGEAPAPTRWYRVLWQSIWGDPFRGDRA